jgi:hypothetical protein
VGLPVEWAEGQIRAWCRPNFAYCDKSSCLLRSKFAEEIFIQNEVEDDEERVGSPGR